jgi:hypothetical protein
VHNGYQKSDDIFLKNNRVRQLRVLFSGGESQIFILEDKLSAQLLTLRRPVQAYWLPSSSRRRLGRQQISGHRDRAKLLSIRI